MKIKTSELTDSALDWAVELSLGGTWRPYIKYSTDWAQGGPIIEREQIDLRSSVNEKGEPVWIAEWWAPAMTPQELRTKRLRSNQYASDTKPLIAAMRCFVASKLGTDVNIPEELA